MLKTNKQIKKAVIVALFAMFTVPSAISAGSGDYYGSDSWGGWSGWGGDTYSYDYTPTYSYEPVYDYDYGYTPSYTSPSYGYTSPSYGYGSYTAPSYSSYVPSYSSYSQPSSSNNANANNNDNDNDNTNDNDNSNENNNENDNDNTNTNNIDNQNKLIADLQNKLISQIRNTLKLNNEITNNNQSAANSNSSSSATGGNATGGNASNVNNNNVYVYTNPTGNAVVQNPAHQYLNGYCVITPANARLGQTVVATAYATGGIGNYTYSWSGDIYTATGVTTQFTSYTAGTKNIIVTIRSDQEVITKTCSVTFDNNTNHTYSTYNQPYYTSSSVNFTPSSGTPVGGVYLSELPATGISLNFTHYMVGLMVLVLATVFTFIYQARKKLLVENI